VTNYGARIVRIEVPDKNGNKDNITIGSDKLDMILRGDAFGGASIGRFANRIANGKFTLDGTEYTLPINNAPNTLHGGPNGWFTKEWNSEIVKGEDPAVKFSYVSPDMESGFPGTVSISVTYTWNDENEIIIDYAASTDKKTVINVTNHAYFNLHGAGKGYIFDHILTIKASTYTPLNATKIPTGKIVPVQGTPYDFTSPHPIGYKIGETFGTAAFEGYDDNFILDRHEKVNATVYDPESGRFMEVITDQPAIQFYCGMGAMRWKKSLDSGEKPTSTRSAFALETQHYPDSPNQPGFPTTVLIPGEKFTSRTIYRFSVKKE
jgi:aldose 1-epimerase